MVERLKADWPAQGLVTRRFTCGQCGSLIGSHQGFISGRGENAGQLEAKGAYGAVYFG
jgi:hypothetical protein